jgi:predicted MPP superfamily phosphohydrolase
LVAAPAILVLPIAALLDRGLLHVFRRSTDERSTREPTTDAPHERTRPGRVSRRALIRAGTASLPAMAALTGVRGLAGGRERPRVRVVPIGYEDLHPDLDGLRILQLSDLHLGACAGLEDLAEGLRTAIRAQRPDLIVLTGDLADDPRLIPGALELAARAGARHGVFASLGNHEYLHDIHVTRPHYDASGVPLLVSTGRTLSIGRARLFIGGADDPVHMSGDIAGMLHPSITRASAHSPAEADFRLLLCHRPEGFGPAADAGFDLTLSGHTHGGQLGVFGRSILEKLRPGTGWWGLYTRKRSDRAALRSKLASSPSRLYTTSGFGHWFPFRVGCPTEMPVLVLQRQDRLRPKRGLGPAA